LKVLVLGGGPAGLTAALQARELHAEVTLLESKRVGGTNINEGPAPVRTLARAARLVRDVGSWETFGLQGVRPRIDLAAVLANALPKRRGRPLRSASKPCVRLVTSHGSSTLRSIVIDTLRDMFCVPLVMAVAVKRTLVA
jgi:glycine/D-amino acid oxidase-like deaminating enzyme